MIRSFGDLSNNWMTRTFRELQHLGREWWMANRRLSYHLTTMKMWVYIPVNMEHQRYDTGSHERVSATKRASISTQPVEKNQEVFRTRWSHKEMLTHLDNSAICKILDTYNHSWSSCILLQIWWEAIMMQLSWSDFWQETHIANVEGKARQKLTIMRKLAGKVTCDVLIKRKLSSKHQTDTWWNIIRLQYYIKLYNIIKLTNTRAHKHCVPKIEQTTLHIIL